MKQHNGPPTEEPREKRCEGHRHAGWARTHERSQRGKSKQPLPEFLFFLFAEIFKCHSKRQKKKESKKKQPFRNGPKNAKNKVKS